MKLPKGIFSSLSKQLKPSMRRTPSVKRLQTLPDAYGPQREIVELPRQTLPRKKSKASFFQSPPPQLTPTICKSVKEFSKDEAKTTNCFFPGKTYKGLYH